MDTRGDASIRAAKQNAEKVIKEYFYKHENVKNAEKMIKEYFNQYVYNTD
jgi:hypothetical protein